MVTNWSGITFRTARKTTPATSLAERFRLLKHAEFFVGLSSGLSWLAWASGTPVVMISGFTHPTNEFETPYRVINYHACNSCWNDPRLRFDHKDFFWCPRHKGTPRQFECTRLITVDQVKQTIQRFRISPFSQPGIPAPMAERTAQYFPVCLLGRDFIRVLSKLNMRLPAIFGPSPANRRDTLASNHLGAPR